MGSTPRPQGRGGGAPAQMGGWNLVSNEMQGTD